MPKPERWPDMLTFPKKLSEARILISNDDSIHAEGIKVLEEIVSEMTPHVWVVAPETQMSAAGHSLTIHMPLRIKQYDKRHYSVSGTPTDSVLLGVRQVMKDFKPDIVLTGINHGQNTADDVTYSGTIAAAIEATLMGIPAIACSQDYDEIGGKPDWSVARDCLPRILEAFAGQEIDNHTLLSVNFPRKVQGVIPQIRPVIQGHYSMSEQEMNELTDPRGRPYYWIGPIPPRADQNEENDMGALNAGHVTITPLSLNLTHHPALKTLKGMFA